MKQQGILRDHCSQAAVQIDDDGEVFKERGRGMLSDGFTAQVCLNIGSLQTEKSSCERREKGSID